MDEQTFTSPRGHAVRLACRAGTNDADMARSCLNEDEYGLAELDDLSGTALDIGAHIGQVTLGLLADHPRLYVIAVEPVPENVIILKANLDRNGWHKRASVLHGAIGPGRSTTIAYRFSGSESAERHTWVANQHMPADIPHHELKVRAWAPEELVDYAQGPITLAVLDCEGCEAYFLASPTAKAIPRLYGESHDGPAVELFRVVR